MKWTTISLKETTKKRLIEVQGALTLTMGKHVSLDETVEYLADHMMIAVKDAATKVLQIKPSEGQG